MLGIRTLAGGVGVALALPAVALAQDPPKPSINTAASEIRASLPASGKARRAILTQLSTANRLAKRGDVCGARKALVGVRSAALRTGSGRPSLDQRSAIAAQSLQAESLLLFRRGASKCGGASKLPALRPTVNVISQSKSEVTVDVRLPAPRFLTSKGIGRGASTPFVQLDMGSLGSRLVPGEPSTPSMTRLVAIPQGASPQLKVLSTDGITLPNVDLEPEQDAEPEQGSDQAPPPGTGRFDDPRLAAQPFRVDSTVYRAARAFPATPVQPRSLGDVRGLQIVSLDLAGAQYQPKSRRLKVLTNVRFKLTFSGGTGFFTDQRLAQPAERQFLAPLLSSVVNAASVFGGLAQFTGGNPSGCGEDMVIFSAPALREQANRYAASRTARGVVTRVFTVGENGLTTNEAMRQFVMGRIFQDECARRPRYVLLFGDHQAIPGFRPSAEYGSSVTTDMSYGLKTVGTLIPSAYVGRIPAETLGEAEAVVTKLIAFEGNPPTDAAFYNKATVAGFFQIRDSGSITYSKERETRTFVEDAETARNALVSKGKTVDRYYTKESDATPKKFNNNTSLPASLLQPTFPWNDTGAEIKAAWNEGRYLFFHRDHGFWQGWGDPRFDNAGDAAPAGLTNGNRLPLVLSINCESGYYDTQAGFKSFAESLLLDPDGGAFAVVAASRITWTPTNSPLSRGLIQGFTGASIYPPAPATPITNLGEGLYYGKILMLLHTSSTSAAVRDTMRLFNLFGDPSMRLRSAPS